MNRQTLESLQIAKDHSHQMAVTHASRVSLLRSPSKSARKILEKRTLESRWPVTLVMTTKASATPHLRMLHQAIYDPRNLLAKLQYTIPNPRRIRQ